jgi:hypothetical protein
VAGNLCYSLEGNPFTALSFKRRQQIVALACGAGRQPTTINRSRSMLLPLSAVYDLSRAPVPVDYFPLVRDWRWDSSDPRQLRAVELGPSTYLFNSPCFPVIGSADGHQLILAPYLYIALQNSVAWSSFRHSLMVYLIGVLLAIICVQGLLLKWIETRQASLVSTQTWRSQLTMYRSI